LETATALVSGGIAMRIVHTRLLAVSLAAAMILAGYTQFASACGDPSTMSALLAVEGDEAPRAKAIQRLRALGPRGLQALADVHAQLLPGLAPPPAVKSLAADLAAQPAAAGEKAERLREALEQVAQQRGAHNSLLYWYKDFAAAQEEARRSGRPILSLRLLGKLTDEYSCANSRFFRTVLYANQEVANYLRDAYVLHWSSERPVPVMTVDFGDGRVLKRTLTGNSAHYVLDAQGRPIDVIPGLYGPQMFLRTLKDDAEAAKLDDAGLRKYHVAKLRATTDAWASDLAAIGGPDIRHHAALPTIARLERVTTDEHWQKLAAFREYGRLDDASKALVRAERPPGGVPAPDAMRIAVSKSAVETPLMVATMATIGFERNVSQDTIRNEFRLHSKIHEWFAKGDRTADFARLNQRVYAELFLTPAGDPWLGLAPAAYTGLDGAGMSVSAVR